MKCSNDHAPDPRPRHEIVQVRRNGERMVVARPVANEVRIELFVNERRLLAFNCSELQLREMVVGFLWLEQIITTIDDIDLLAICDDDRRVDVRLAKEIDIDAFEHRRALTSSCGGGVTFQDLMEARNITPVTGGPTVRVGTLFDLITDLFKGSAWYRASGGLHAAALADPNEGILILCEDLGRHNAIDKIAGACLLRGVDPGGCILLSTGRMSSDMVIKAARMRVPIVASRTSPTDLSLALARQFGLTIVGYLRGDRCHVYNGHQRIAPPDEPSAVLSPSYVP